MQIYRGEVSQPGADKLVCFDAVRGLAALEAVVAHTMLAYWPGLYFRSGPAWEQCPVWAQWFYRFPGKYVVNGLVIVPLFYILSGFVLSLTFFQGGSALSLGSAAVRRYLRLMLPVAASIFLAYALLKAGVMYNHAAVEQLDEAYGFAQQSAPDPRAGWSNNWLSSYYNVAPSLLSAVRESVWDAFTGVSQYNLPLYTMPTELAGSFLVYGFLALFGSLRNRWLLYGIVACVCVLGQRMFMLDFLMGIALCDLWRQNQQRCGRSLMLGPALALIAGAIFLLPWGHVTALLIIGTVAVTPRLQQLLSARWLAFLGQTSFGLYVIHMPIYCSLGCGLYVLLCRDQGWSHAAGSVTAAMTGLTVSLAAAWSFFRIVDRPTIALTRWVDVWLFRPRANESAKPQAEYRPRLAA
jgi:peptidoglycan/LPS O-acetylase OafA/YrhL